MAAPDVTTLKDLPSLNSHVQAGELVPQDVKSDKATLADRSNWGGNARLAAKILNF